MELPATLHQPGPTPDWMPVGELIVASFTARMSDLPAPTRRLLLAAALGNDVPLGRLFAAAAAAGAESAVVGDLQPAVEEGFLTVAGDRIWFGHRLVAAAIYQSSTIADRLAMQPRCRMRSAPTTIDGCGTLKRLLQFILRAARRQPARDSRSGVSSPMVRAPSNCMIRRNSPARMSSTYATPLGPPAISPYRSARPIRQPLGSTGHRSGDVDAGANPTVDQDLHLGPQSRTDVGDHGDRCDRSVELPSTVVGQNHRIGAQLDGQLRIRNGAHTFHGTDRTRNCYLAH